MSKIGDLWFALRGDPKQLNVDVNKAGDKAGDSFGKRMAAGFKKSWSGQNIGKGLIQGLGLAGGLGAAAVFSTAISKVTDIIGDSIQAAREDQVSIQKLGTALRDNIPNWDGNTDAIERVLKARMKLGFSDDEQRTSLATLAAATHDVTKSLELERGAMDISRARGIDLAAASDAVAKAYAGNTKGLKQMLPGLKLGATAAETLANAFAMVKGAGDDFAKTEEGRMVVAQVKVNESMETFGYKILPAVTDALVGTADAVTGLSGTLDILQKGVAKTNDGQKEQAQALVDYIRALGVVTPLIGSLSDELETQLDAALADAAGFNVLGDNSINMAEKVKSAGGSLDNSFGIMAAAAQDFRNTYRDVTGDIIRRSNRMRSELVKDAAIVRGDVFDETEIRASLHDQRLEQIALAERRRDAKTAEDKRQASDDIIQALDDQGASLEDLAGIGKLTSKDVDRFEADAKKSYKSLSKEGQKQIDDLIAKYRALAKLPNISKTFTLNTRQGSGTHPGGGGPQEFAEGGTVRGPIGKPQLVIAHGGERVLSLPELRAARSMVLPDMRIPAASQSIAAISGGGGGGNETNIIQVQGLLPVTTMADIRRERTHLQDARRLRNGLGRR